MLEFFGAYTSANLQ